MTQIKRWISIETDENTWLLDTQFLLSGYKCSWGNGCRGMFGDTIMGCCGLGAYLTEEESDDVKRRVEMLKPSEWQLHGTEWLESKRWPRSKAYEKTRVVHHDGIEGCVFNNRTGFSGGEGCAFHIAAMNRGENPIDWKPEVCWTVPLCVEWIDGIHSWVVRMRSHLDFQSGDDSFNLFEHWCGSDDVAWRNKVPVYRSYEEELRRLIEREDEQAWPMIQSALEELWMTTPYDELPIYSGPRPVPVTLVSRNPDDYS